MISGEAHVNDTLSLQGLGGIFKSILLECMGWPTW